MLKNWLNYKIIFPEFRRTLFYILLSSSFVVVFLFFFKPFNLISEGVIYYGYIGFGVINIIVITIVYAFLKYIININELKNYQMMILRIIVVLILSICNFYFNEITKTIQNLSYIDTLKYTFGMGVITGSIFIYHQTKDFNKNNTKFIKITSKYTKRELILERDNVYYIQSDKGYCDIFFKERNSIKIETIRTTLNDLEIQLKKINFFKRIHKSYIINTYKISEVLGTKKNPKIKLLEIENEIPISRSMDISDIINKSFINT